MSKTFLLLLASSVLFFTLAKHGKSFSVFVCYFPSRMTKFSVFRSLLKARSSFTFTRDSEKRHWSMETPTREEGAGTTTRSAARCVYLTGINWFIDNFAREDGERRARRKEKSNFSCFHKTRLEKARLFYFRSSFNYHFDWVLKSQKKKQTLNKSQRVCVYVRAFPRFSILFHWMKRKQRRNHGRKNKVQGQWKPISHIYPLRFAGFYKYGEVGKEENSPAIKPRTYFPLPTNKQPTAALKLEFVARMNMVS